MEKEKHHRHVLKASVVVLPPLSGSVEPTRVPSPCSAVLLSAVLRSKWKSLDHVHVHMHTFNSDSLGPHCRNIVETFF